MCPLCLHATRVTPVPGAVPAEQVERVTRRLLDAVRRDSDRRIAVLVDDLLDLVGRVADLDEDTAEAVPARAHDAAQLLHRARELGIR